MVLLEVIYKDINAKIALKYLCLKAQFQAKNYLIHTLQKRK